MKAVSIAMIVGERTILQSLMTTELLVNDWQNDVSTLLHLPADTRRYA